MECIQDFIQIESLDEFYSCTVDCLYKLIGEKAVITAVEYNLEENSWEMKAIEGVSGVSEKIASVLGFDLMAMKGEVRTTFFKDIKKGKLKKLELDFPALTNEMISQRNGEFVLKMLSLNELYCITFQNKERVFGNVSLFLKEEIDIEKIGLIENFFSQISLILKNKWTEERLRYKDLLYTSFIEQSSDAIAMINSRYEIVEWNEKEVDISGIPKKEALNKKLWDVQWRLLPDNLKKKITKEQFVKRIKDTLGNLHNTDQEHTYESGIQRPDGVLKVLETKLFLIQFANETLIGSIGRDITHQKESELELQRSELKFKELMHKSPSVIEIYNMEGYQVEVNAAYERLWNFPAEHTINKFNLFESKEVERTGLLKYIRRAYKGETVILPDYYKYDSRGKTEARGKGRVRWLNTRIYPIKDANGKVVNITITHEDVTERKAFEEKLIDLKNQLDLILDNIPVVIWLLSYTKDGYKVDYVSPKIKDFFGITQKQFYKDSYLWMSSVYPEDKIWLEKKFLRFLEDKERWNVQYRVVDKEGEEKWLLSRGKNLGKDDDGRVRVTGILYDRTDKIRSEMELEEKSLQIDQQNNELQAKLKEIRKINKKLKKAKARAVEADELKTAFLANMSHEIRTPMNALLGFSGLLADSEKPREKIDRYVKLIEKSGDQLLTIIDDIIDIAKIESNQIHLYKSRFNLHDFFSGIYETRQQNLNENRVSVEFRFEFKLEKDETIYSDEVRLAQVVNNLLNNAFKFTEKGYVLLKVEKIFRNEKRFIKVTVKDTGSGIPKAKAKMIFDRFVQIGTAEFKGGTGIGLSISKGLIELLGGKIKLESVMGEGSDFSFTIPLSTTEK